MEEIKKLTDDEINDVAGGNESAEGEYDSLQLLDRYEYALYSGDWIKILEVQADILANATKFIADVKSAGRTLPKQLVDELSLHGFNI